MKALEKILEISVEKKIPATSLLIEYLHYLHNGLKSHVAVQYLDLKYLNKNYQREYKV